MPKTKSKDIIHGFFANAQNDTSCQIEKTNKDSNKEFNNEAGKGNIRETPYYKAADNSVP
jgi:hypothetical protein